MGFGGSASIPFTLPTVSTLALQPACVGGCSEASGRVSSPRMNWEGSWLWEGSQLQDELGGLPALGGFPALEGSQLQEGSQPRRVPNSRTVPSSGRVPNSRRIPGSEKVPSSRGFPAPEGSQPCTYRTARCCGSECRRQGRSRAPRTPGGRSAVALLRRGGISGHGRQCPAGTGAAGGTTVQHWSLPPSPQPMGTLVGACTDTSGVLGFLTFQSS